MDLLGEIGRVWKDDRARVDFAAAELFDRLKSVAGADGRSQAESSVAGPEALAEAVEQYQVAFDRRHGGFGESPKFPRPSELLFLLREYARTGARPPLTMATETLRAMALGGMRDHVGGGFHRYSVDAEWRVPHFEKMLYDQAQLVLAYLEAAQADAATSSSRRSRKTRWPTSRATCATPAGGFYSAEDADSAPCRRRTQEGRRLLRLERRRDRRAARRGRRHRPQALRDRAGRQRAARSASGVHRPEPALHRAHDRGDRGRNRTRPPTRSSPRSAARGRSCSTPARQRPRPHLDDKVLTSWNGMMIAAFARAARVLPDRPQAAEWLATARAAAEFIRDHLWRAGRRHAPAPLPRRRRVDRGLRRGLRVAHLGRARAVPGGRRSRVAVVGARAAGAAGRALLGCAGRRMVQHHGPRSVRAAAAQGRLRRRRAVRQLRVGPQPPHARAPHRRRGGADEDRADARPLRRSRRTRRARDPDDARRALDLARRRDADRRARLRERREAAAGGNGAPLPAVRAAGAGRPPAIRSARWRRRCRSSGHCGKRTAARPPSCAATSRAASPSRARTRSRRSCSRHDIAPSISRSTARRAAPRSGSSTRRGTSSPRR